MGSREIFNRITNLHQLHYCINKNYESIFHLERWTRNRPKLFAILNKDIDFWKVHSSLEI